MFPGGQQCRIGPKLDENSNLLIFLIQVVLVLSENGALNEKFADF